MKILIAMDESKHSEEALRFVTRMRWPAGSRVIVLSVVQPISATVSPYEPVPAEAGLMRQQHRRLEVVVAGAERVLRDAGFSTECRIAEGDAREAVIEAARAERADLVVVGSHGRTGLAKLWLGSVSSHVVTHAPCSVMVVKEANR